MNLWRFIVETYSKCSLSRKTDRLIAFSGLAKSFRPLLEEDDYLAGLWRSEGARQLLWKKSRDVSASNRDNDRAPSWSWASMDTPITYANPRQHAPEDDYQAQIEHHTFAGLDTSSGPRASDFIQVRGKFERAFFADKSFGSRQLLVRSSFQSPTSIQVIMDTDEQDDVFDEDSPEYFLLALVSYPKLPSRDRRTVEGIVLERAYTSRVKDSFQRIGVFTLLETQKQLEEQQRRCEELEIDVSQKTQEIKRLRMQLEDAEFAAANSDKDISALRQNIKNLQEIFKHVKEQKDALEDDLDEAKTRARKSQRDLQIAREEAAERERKDPLRQLRRKDEGVLLWVDALCINQSDDQEKAEQVGKMGQIFQRAASVVAWIGPQQEDSDLAMDWVARAGDHTLDLEDPMHEKHLDLKTALLRLFDLPYWSRIWIVQELVRARTLVYQCGSASVTEGQLRAAVNTLRDLKYEFWDQCRNPQNAVMLRTYAGLPPLIFLLRTFRHFEASLGQDKIFALLGLARDVRALRPDYASPCEATYTAFARALIDAGYVEILSLCEARRLGGGDLRLPSWVPDWSRKGDRDPLQQPLAAI
ncbi:hypothetical protein SLS57_008222 [Botryosphaeria dothidea]